MADPQEFIYIRHPDTDAIGGPVTRQALDTVLCYQGWEEADADEQGLIDEARQVAQMTGMDLDAAKAAVVTNRERIAKRDAADAAAATATPSDEAGAPDTDTPKTSRRPAGARS